MLALDDVFEKVVLEMQRKSNALEMRTRKEFWVKTIVRKVWETRSDTKVWKRHLGWIV